MKYISTRNPDHQVDLSQALLDGLAPDGGLYVPAELPELDPKRFESASHIRYIANDLLEAFFVGDELEDDLADICEETFGFDIPLREIGQDTALLELFHGPTAAFKDVGAGFLASCLSRLNQSRLDDTRDRAVTVLVATSGDTGGAVAAAFHEKPNVNVVVLYPKGKVSPRQEKQLTCWGENVRTFGVHGVFDDCQRMVKEAFADQAFRDEINLTSANSINVGRLLPQMTYYAASSLWYQTRHGAQPNYVIPSGNLGNALACLWARECGLPIGQVVLAVNENMPVVHYLETGEYKGFDTVATVANAMDVGDPSNMERVRFLWPQVETLRQNVSAYQVDDDTIRQTIKDGEDRWGQVFDPHTACGVAVREQLDSPHWIVVSTAHPAKFDTIVEPLVGHDVDVPEQLAELLDRPDYSTEIEASLDALKTALADE
jgi:threonine synthase